MSYSFFFPQETNRKRKDAKPIQNFEKQPNKRVNPINNKEKQLKQDSIFNQKTKQK